MFGSGVLRRVKKAGTDLMNKVPTKSVSSSKCHANNVLCFNFVLNFQNRRSMLDESRLTQSQFALGFDSGGNDSDNSAEDPHSTASETNLLKKESQITIQRKSNDQQSNERIAAASNFPSMIRDDLVRTSRNTMPG